jgi:hypothetical protein
MSRNVHVELSGPRETSELVQFLAGRGLGATVVDGNGCCALDIAYAIDPDERLRDDVARALRDWLAGRESPLVLSEAGDGGYVLRPPGE